MLSSLTLNGLQLLGSTSFTVVAPVDGLEAPDRRLTAYNKPGEDGGVVSAAYYGQRAITLSGTVLGTTNAAHEAARRSLAAACTIARDSYGYPSGALLQFTTTSGTSYFTYVDVRALRNPIENITFSNYQLQLVAPDHRLYLTGQNTTGVISLPSGGGFTLPFVLPVTFAATSGGTSSATNTGDTTASPILTLKGQLTNPYVLNQTTGRSIQLNRTIAVGETVVIDMGAKTIMLNGTTSLLSAKANDSDWWGLAAGVNSLRFSSGSVSDTGTLEVTWYSAVMGI